MTNSIKEVLAHVEEAVTHANLDDGRLCTCDMTMARRTYRKLDPADREIAHRACLDLLRDAIANLDLVRARAINQVIDRMKSVD